MVKLAGALSCFHPFTALVVGDFMLDVYTSGRVRRISPEAPVPVMEVLRTESRPGGAGNVVLNLIALGAKVVPFGRIGADSDGVELKSALSCDMVDLQYIMVDEDYRTPVKNRLISDSQQLLRVDWEKVFPITADFEKRILDQLQQVLPMAQVVALSDYAKGFLSCSLIDSIITLARSMKIPVIVDPKGIDFQKYRGATVLKPNLSEAYAAARMAREEPLDAVAARILQICEVDHLMITRSESGISLFKRDGSRSDFAVRSREVKDVTGAGDTVLAMVSAALANGLDIAAAAQLANIAAGIAIERLGCVQVTMSEIARRFLESDVNSKVFDDSYTYALRQVLKDRCYSLLVLPKKQKISNALFRILRQMKHNSNNELIVYVRGCDTEDEFINFLSSLQEVDYIILQSKSLKKLCQSIHPSEVYFLEDDKLCVYEVSKAAPE
jgi:rfaE bifunctional protein kinase chain/domain